jgi:hypothetical protein
MSKKMTKERWNYLMQPFEGNEDVMLTAEELNEGWHWCEEWDGLLIHVDDDEFVSCNCGFMEKFRTPERIKAMQDKIAKWKEPQDAMQRLADLDEELGLNPGQEK